ncbi:hypothetical protein DASB73_006050 [Starmerella bacillaris]|uniref:Uncharacterized protein n=1 Tax=Starmerella bacillaris TaxID=1247836 RepID=A0AAV5REW1_STABA|nr:hypothetical protein DASB73_006050 [Starmerella bacillaris]
MVTAKKVYTREELDVFIDNPQRILRSHARKAQVITADVYFDYTLDHNPFASFSEGPFLLLRLHFKQLQFTSRCLGWSIDIYSQRKQILSRLYNFTLPEDNILKGTVDAVAGLEGIGTSIHADHTDDAYGGNKHGLVRLTLDEQGKMDMNLLDFEEKFTLNGLIDHLSFLNNDPLLVMDNLEYFVTSLDPIPVFIDTQPTIECFYTTFSLAETWPFDEADARIKKKYANNQDLESNNRPDFVDSLQAVSIQPQYPNETNHPSIFDSTEPSFFSNYGGIYDPLHLDSAVPEFRLEKLITLATLNAYNTVLESMGTSDIKMALRTPSKTDDLADELLNKFTSSNNNSNSNNDDDNGANESQKVLDADNILALTYNPLQQVLNAGFFTIAFLFQGQWVTPHASTGCRIDPLRQALLEMRIIHENIISVHDLEDMEDCILINSAFGVLRGVVSGTKPVVLSKVGRKRPAAKPKNETKVISEKEAARRSAQAQMMQGDKIPGTSVFRA